ncbi:FadR/GntR family transcriptional regulator [Paralimibaculum aggregatum]|uniref:FadR/GntR family transcriptional regulator n=2 Tax=Paralimibaculum aggregatum TaxID=3036245 RepID=A0ABQ6LU24_9RHOB|nr:FadR/GntR family transcriptional regulator [Limibaculum sp. NKW23]
MVERDLKPGDRLPAEADLIVQFGAAKSTVREAMRLLEAQGLVRSRTGPGGGHFVHEVSELRAQSLLANYFYFRPPSISDIYQIRRVLEPELAASLAGKVSEEDLQRLERAMASYESPPESIEESEAQRIAELDFHEVLAELSENSLLAFQCRFLIGLLKNLAVCRKIYKRRIPDFRRLGRDYQVRLIQALRSGDADAARAIMLAHMQSAQHVMERQEATLPRNFLTG